MQVLESHQRDHTESGVLPLQLPQKDPTNHLARQGYSKKEVERITGRRNMEEIKLGKWKWTGPKYFFMLMASVMDYVSLIEARP